MKIVSYYGKHPLHTNLSLRKDKKDAFPPVCPEGEEAMLLHYFYNKNIFNTMEEPNAYILIQNWRRQLSLVKLQSPISGFFTKKGGYKRIITPTGLFFSTRLHDDYIPNNIIPPEFNEESVILYRRISLPIAKDELSKMRKPPQNKETKLQNLITQLEQGRQQIVKWEQELTQKEHSILARMPFSHYFL